MTRLPRLDVPGVPQHVVQRGNNRGRCFIEEQDYQAYLSFLRDKAQELAVDVHAYVLMGNHVHLLLSSEAHGHISRLMQALGRRYVHYFNDRYSRTGTLYEGRFRSGLVDTEGYLLCCYRYIELNPVRAAIVRHPGEYPWSSYRSNALGEPCNWLKLHPVLEALGPDREQRCAAYRALVDEGLTDGALADIRSHLNQGCALGTPSLHAQVAKATNRRTKVTARGRPPKAK